MHRLLKGLARVLGYGALALVVLLVLALASVFLFFPRSAPASPQPLARTQARLARGQYLLRNVTGCLDCHSERNWRQYSGPVDGATTGRGALVTLFGKPTWSANITPAGIGDWSDGEVVRGITAGIKKDGSPVNPQMSYDTYAQLSEEDVDSIVVYLRTLPPIEHPQPPNHPGPVIGVVQRLLPSPWKPRPAPPPADPVAMGKYLVNAAECDVCHRLNLAGGRSFVIPGGGGATVVSTNLTPDPQTGIGSMRMEVFVGLFKALSGRAQGADREVAAGTQTVMPWARYSGMVDEDLVAIYDYLHTLPPVKNDVPSRWRSRVAGAR
jgi:mono/diheme cytochrome c family protein